MAKEKGEDAVMSWPGSWRGRAAWAGGFNYKGPRP